MSAAPLKVAVLTALLDRHEVRGIIERLYSRTADRGDRVRCSVVADLVAAELGVAVSWVLRRKVRHAAAMGGWALVTRGPSGEPLYTNMRAR